MSLHRLEVVQNTAVRLISKIENKTEIFLKRYDHIFPVLKELLWLPVEQRIKFSKF